MPFFIFQILTRFYYQEQQLSPSVINKSFIWMIETLMYSYVLKTLKIGDGVNERV